MKIRLVQDLFTHIVIILQHLRESLILQFQQELIYYHQQLLQLQLERQVVELTQVQLWDRQLQQLQLPHPHQAVDLALAADINDRHINTKSRNQSGN